MTQWHFYLKRCLNLTNLEAHDSYCFVIRKNKDYCNLLQFAINTNAKPAIIHILMKPVFEQYISKVKQSLMEAEKKKIIILFGVYLPFGMQRLPYLIVMTDTSLKQQKLYLTCYSITQILNCLNLVMKILKIKKPTRKH